MHWRACVSLWMLLLLFVGIRYFWLLSSSIEFAVAAARRGRQGSGRAANLLPTAAAAAQHTSGGQRWLELCEEPAADGGST